MNIVSIKQFLKKRFPLLVSIKRFFWKPFGSSNTYTGEITLNILKTFPLFATLSGGDHKERSQLAIQTINQVMPFLSDFAASLGCRQVKAIPISSFPDSQEALESANDLKKLLDGYGSDKANLHSYHLFYGTVLKDRNNIKAVFEVGLGTNNIEVVSSMGAQGKPGASLRAFRDFLNSAKIFGADIDKQILFRENRIETFFVDQTNPKSFLELESSLPSELDLVIDDGLHSPDANLATLNFGLRKIKIGGWAVVEDIAPEAKHFWDVVAGLLPDKFEPHFFQPAKAMLFAVKRLS